MSAQLPAPTTGHLRRDLVAILPMVNRQISRPRIYPKACWTKETSGVLAELESLKRK